MIETTIDINEKRKIAMAQKIIELSGGSVKGKDIAILGLAFKPNTDDMRDASSLVIIPKLIENGARINAYDPQSMIEAKKILNNPQINWCENAVQAFENADTLVILTEWNEFRSIDLKSLKQKMKGNAIADLRNIFDPKEIEENGFKYYSLGR